MIDRKAPEEEIAKALEASLHPVSSKLSGYTCE